jgi:hypothetical protein
MDTPQSHSNAEPQFRELLFNDSVSLAWWHPDIGYVSASLVSGAINCFKGGFQLLRPLDSARAD